MEKRQFIEKVDKFLTVECNLDEAESLIVAVSGGADSVALLLVLHYLRRKFVVAHCNFHLRGEESNRDEEFVRSLCATLGVDLEVIHFDVHAFEVQHKVSTEMACRELRYAWFRELKEKYDSRWIAVAHHSDDAIETFFLNALRGSGVQGLAAIKPISGDVVRPLLCVSRRDVEDFLAACGQSYVTDSTNKENDFKRNKIRNIVLPLLYEQFRGAEAGLLRTIHDMRSAAQLYSELVSEQKNKVCSTVDGRLIIDKSSLTKIAGSEALLYEIVKEYGFNSAQCEDIVAAIGESGKRFYSEDYSLVVERNHISVEKISKAEIDSYEVNLDDTASLPIEMVVEEMEGEFSRQGVDGRNVVAFGMGLKTTEKLVLRHWRVGDRFRPFGLKGTKLLSDLFADMKLTDYDKRNVWILEADGEIVWVLGLRAADAFRIKKDDNRYLKLRYEK